MTPQFKITHLDIGLDSELVEIRLAKFPDGQVVAMIGGISLARLEQSPILAEYVQSQIQQLRELNGLTGEAVTT